MIESEVRVLIIEDEATLRSSLQTTLVGEKYLVRAEGTGQSGLDSVQEFHPHVIILDLNLPDIKGASVLAQLRGWTRAPVIILTATDDENAKVELLDAGASDYLTKPFGSKELVARVRLAIRNVGLIEATPLFKSQDLEIDIVQKKILKSGHEIKLTNVEFELLARLVRQHGRIVSQAQLMRQIWGPGTEEQTHYLRIYIKQLRKKLETNPSVPVHILTEPGVGYRII